MLLPRCCCVCSRACVQALGLNMQESSFLTLIPYVAMIAMTPVVSRGCVQCGAC
jgi:hypothetical protein